MPDLDYETITSLAWSKNSYYILLKQAEGNYSPQKKLKSRLIKRLSENIINQKRKIKENQKSNAESDAKFAADYLKSDGWREQKQLKILKQMKLKYDRARRRTGRIFKVLEQQDALLWSLIQRSALQNPTTNQSKKFQAQLPSTTPTDEVVKYFEVKLEDLDDRFDCRDSILSAPTISQLATQRQHSCRRKSIPKQNKLGDKDSMGSEDSDTMTRQMSVDYTHLKFEKLTNETILNLNANRNKDNQNSDDVNDREFRARQPVPSHMPVKPQKETFQIYQNMLADLISSSIDTMRPNRRSDLIKYKDVKKHVE